MDKFFNLIKPHMTEKAFQILYIIMTKKLPDAWTRPTSSTGKHHLKADGKVQTTIEHTYEMVYAAIKIARAFKIESVTSDMDVLLFILALHDSMKYGETGQMFHTHKGHDRLIGDKIRDARETKTMIFNDEQCTLLEEGVRFHSGQWSTGLKKVGKENFKWKNYHPITMVVHMLDMLSTNDLLKSDWNDGLLVEKVNDENN